MTPSIMTSLNHPAVLVGLFIVFLIAMKFLTPLLNAGLQGLTKAGGAGAAEASYYASLQTLAQHLGLQFERVEKPDDPKVWQGGGVLLRGTYRGCPMELTFLRETRDASRGLQTAYSYRIDHRITVESPRREQWAVTPKDQYQVTSPTGDAAFDRCLAYVGPAGAIAPTQLQALAAYGWMHLELKDGRLTFTDDYMEFVSQTKGAMAMVSAVHPVWKTSARHYQVDLAAAQQFVDLLCTLATTTA